MSPQSCLGIVAGEIGFCVRATGGGRHPLLFRPEGYNQSGLVLISREEPKMKVNQLRNRDQSALRRGIYLAGSGIALIVGLSLSRSAQAQVYEWTDPSGVRHFSSQKRGEQFKKADLPPIHREKASKVAAKKGAPDEKTLTSCQNHGGIDCQSGPDGDGSVVCVDGFREAAAPFRFFCFMPKLAISEIVTSGEADKFSVIVRNESGVAATKPVITLPSSSGSPKISGPDEIPPREVGEFIVTGTSSVPQTGEVLVGCQNCG